MNAPVDTLGIALPPEWLRFPLEHGDFEGFVRSQRDRLRREANLSRTAERQFEMLMNGLRNDSLAAGVKMVATLLGVVEPDDSPAGDEAGADRQAQEQPEAEGDSELVAASMTMSVITRLETGADVPLTVNTIQAAMSLDRPAGDDGPDGVSVSNLEPPSVVAMPVGEVVKLVRLHRLKHRDSRGGAEFRREVPMFVQHFFVPIDGAGSSAVVVTFTTPTVSLARPMSELFDAMMQTFEMFSGDDMTDPARAPGSGPEGSPAEGDAS